MIESVYLINLILPQYFKNTIVGAYIIYNGIEDGGYNLITGEKLDSTGVPNVDIQFEKVNIENYVIILKLLVKEQVIILVI